MIFDNGEDTVVISLNAQFTIIDLFAGVGKFDDYVRVDEAAFVKELDCGFGLVYDCRDVW